MIHRTLVIGAALVALVAASIVYVGSRGMAGPSAFRPTPSQSAAESPATLSCPPTELKLTGVFDECVAIDRGQSCPAGSLDQARVVLLRGTKDEFLLYIEVKGAYHGPATYALVPWPHDTLGVSDGVAKVAIRERTTGALWESSAGSVTIGQTEEFGWVYAGLGASKSSPVDVSLNLAGWWSCS